MTNLYIKTSDRGLQYFGKTIQDPHKYKGSGKHWIAHLKKHKPEVQTMVIGEYEDNDPMLIEHALGFSVANNIVLSNDWANLKVEDGLTGGAMSKESQIQATESGKLFRETEEGKKNIKIQGINRKIYNETVEGKKNLVARGNKQKAFYQTEEGKLSLQKQRDSQKKFDESEIGKDIRKRAGKKRTVTMSLPGNKEVVVNNGRKNYKIKESQLWIFLNLYGCSRGMVPYDKVVCPHCSKSGGGGNMKRYHFDNCKEKENNEKSK